MSRLRPLLLFFVLLVSACQPRQFEPTRLSAISTPVQSWTPAPATTLTGTPTRTPRPTSPPLTATASPSVTPFPSPTQPVITTLLFTGVIVPARCVQAAIDASGNPDYLYDEVRQMISHADLAVGTLNATISDYPPHTGCSRTFVLVGGASNADALAHAGFDVMSVATNHIKNCGPANCGNRAFFDTLDNLRRVGILPVGAGANLEQAMRPVVVSVNGLRFGIVSLGQIEPMAFAGADSPGIAVLDPENLQAAITAAKQVSDVVIAMPHWGPEDVAVPNYLQRKLAQQAVDAGADLVVGNHTHVVQAVQEISGVPVFYGLGNFIFDQTWADDHQQGVMLLVRFEGKRYLGYELIPTHVDGNGRVHIAGPQEASEVLGRIEAASRAIR